jgi:perosamine synthetase
MWHLFPIRVPSTHRREIFDELRNRGIFVQVNYLPAYRHPVFSSLGFEEGDFPLSDNYFAGEISLPIYNDLEVNQQDFIIQSVLEIFESKFSSKF